MRFGVAGFQGKAQGAEGFGLRQVGGRQEVGQLHLVAVQLEAAVESGEIEVDGAEKLGSPECNFFESVDVPLLNFQDLRIDGLVSDLILLLHTKFAFLLGGGGLLFHESAAQIRGILLGDLVLEPEDGVGGKFFPLLLVDYVDAG